MQASKHFHNFQEKYASMHTARHDDNAKSQNPRDKPLSPLWNSQRAEQAAIQPSAAAHKRASTCQQAGSSISDRSQNSGRPAPTHKQRKRRHETTAALADPLGAFACQATRRQRTLQSGLSLLKGKTSQACYVAPNLRPPKELASDLDTYRFQSPNTAVQPNAQPSTANRHKKRHQSQEHMPQQQSPDQHRSKRNGSQHAEVTKGKAKRRPAADVQPSGQLQHSISHQSIPDLNTTPRQANTSYFQDIKRSLHTLVQANHTVPSLHAMSDTDKAALTSMLTNKLNGVNILSDLQQQFFSPSRPAEHARPAKPAEPAAEQQPSAASSVDCTPSPDSVTHHDARYHKLPKPTLPCQHGRLRAFHSVDASHTSHTSAASLGSGHRHTPREDACINSRVSGQRHALTGNGVSSRLTLADPGGCISSRLTAADSRPSRQRHALTDNDIISSGLTVADSDASLFDLHAEPMIMQYSSRQDPDWSCSRNGDTMFLDAEVAAPFNSPMVDWSTNTQAASHLAHYRQKQELEVAPFLAEDGRDDDTDELFRHSSHQHRGLRSDDAFGGPSGEDELFARTIPDEPLLPFQVEDSDVCHHFADAASSQHTGLDADCALPPLEVEDLSRYCHISSEAAHSSVPTDKLLYSKLPATAEDTELDAIFASNANVPSTAIMHEDYGRPSSVSHYGAAMSLEPAWLADRQAATSPLGNASPSSDAVNRLFHRHAMAQHDSWANCTAFPSSTVPDLHKLFGGRGRQTASGHEIDNHTAWADCNESNTELNTMKSDFWSPETH